MTYFDTSALAKWYVAERHSDEVAAYVAAHAPVAISDLTAVEFRALLARLRREREFDADDELRTFARFQEQVRRGFLRQQPLTSDVAAAAIEVLAEVPGRALRSLDALHLGCAREMQAEAFATADGVLAKAAVELGMEVVRF